MLSLLKIRLCRIFFLTIPPVFHVLVGKLWSYKMTRQLPMEVKRLPRAKLAFNKLIQEYHFLTILDVGAGEGLHSDLFARHGKDVTALDFGTSVYAKMRDDDANGVKRIDVDFYCFESSIAYDCLWCSHVLEHQPNPGLFIQKCMSLIKDNGILVITVPPLKHQIVGGHLTLWNAGLLIYQLVFAGLDCRNASVITSQYDISIIVRKKLRPAIKLAWDYGDIDLLKDYFPEFVSEPFDGRIRSWNWF